MQLFAGIRKFGGDFLCVYSDVVDLCELCGWGAVRWWCGTGGRMYLCVGLRVDIARVLRLVQRLWRRLRRGWVWSWICVRGRERTAIIMFVRRGRLQRVQHDCGVYWSGRQRVMHCVRCGELVCGRCGATCGMLLLARLRIDINGIVCVYG
jgi:hypothetical protein